MSGSFERYAAGGVALLAVGCKAAPAAPAPPAPTIVVSPAVASAETAAVVDAGAVPDAGPACGSTELQPGACISMHADLTLDTAGSRQWLAGHGAPAPERAPDACREIALAGEPALVCVERTGTAVDAALGIAGPLLFHFALEVLAVRRSKVAVLLKVPLAIGDSGAFYTEPTSMYFSASFDAKPDAIDVGVPPAECTKALADLPAFFERRKAQLTATVPEAATRTQLLRATAVEQRQTAAEIAAICKAAGHYTPGRDGKLGARP